MNSAIKEIVNALRNDKTHFLVVGGNIYDTVSSGNGRMRHGTFLEFLTELTSAKYPNFVTYDLFHGIKIVRSDKYMRNILNPPKPEKPEENNTNFDDDLMEIVRKAVPQAGSDDDDEEKDEAAAPPLEAFKKFDKLFGDTSVGPAVVVLNYAESFASPSTRGAHDENHLKINIALQEWGRDETIHARGHLIVLLSRSAHELDEAVLSRCGCAMVMRIGKPDEEERSSFLAKSLRLADNTALTLGRSSAGLSLREIEKLVDETGQESSVSEFLDACFVAKQRIFADEYGDLLEIKKAKLGFEVFGDGLNGLIAKMKRIAEAMRNGETSLVPQGMLFAGPPGTGKSLFAEAIAKAGGVNFLFPLDIKSMWVGESERRMTRLLNALKDLFPAIIFIDEFDQNQGQRGGFDGDSGVSRSLFRKMLEFVGDIAYRGKVLWIFATNRSDLIDPAMKRPGRCDLRIPFLMPGPARLVEICKATPLQYPDICSAVTDYTPYVKRCGGYSGADMVEVVRRAWVHAVEDGRKAIVGKDMEFACHDYRPQTLDRLEVARMEYLALKECSSDSFLPEGADELIADRERQLLEAGMPLINERRC